MNGVLFKKGLNGNVLKIIALIAMTVDHVGALMYPHNDVLRIIGRIAMPIFAFMIAEGCFYARKKLKYFLLVFGLGAVCVVGYFIAKKRFYLNILITFSFSILIIYALNYALNKKRASAYLLPALAVLSSAFVNFAMPKITGNSGWEVDYGFFGTLLPVFIYIFKDFRLKLVALCLGLTLIALDFGDVQWWAYLSLVFMLFYDGTRGKLNLKYLFYVYYPVHFVVIYGIYILL